MAINWSILQPTNPAAALQAGIQAGQTWRRETDARGALSALAANPNNAQAIGVLRQAAPEVAFKMEDRLRETQTRAALSAVFAPAQAPASNSVPSALAGFGSGQQQGMKIGQAEPAASNAVPSSPIPAPLAMAPASSGTDALVDPSRLPPRTDGLAINQDALRNLYQVDPASAFKVQQMVHDADAASFKRMQQSGGVMANAAYHLSTIKNPDGSEDVAGRQRELQAITPQLAEMGVSPEMLSRADLTNQGLARYLTLGRNLNNIVADDRANRALDWNIEDDRVDNGRADRSESRQEYYRARSDSRSERSDRRQAVRFRERDKDRAALSGSFGIRSDTSDLDY